MTNHEHVSLNIDDSLCREAITGSGIRRGSGALSRGTFILSSDTLLKKFLEVFSCDDG